MITISKVANHFQYKYNPARACEGVTYSCINMLRAKTKRGVLILRCVCV